MPCAGIAYVGWGKDVSVTTFSVEVIVMLDTGEQLSEGTREHREINYAQELFENRVSISLD